MNISNFENKIICGDSREVLKQFDDNSIDLIFTSPPYANIKNYCSVKPHEYVDWFLPFVVQFHRVVKNTFILNISDKVVDGFIYPYIYELVYKICKYNYFKLYETLFWDKLKGTPTGSRFSKNIEFIFVFSKTKDIYINFDAMRTPYAESTKKRMAYPLKDLSDQYKGTHENFGRKTLKLHPNGAMPSTSVKISSEPANKLNHFAVFPEKLPTYFIKGFTHINDIVLDPFIGSGTTALAAIKNKRRYVGIDDKQEYCTMALNKLKTFEAQQVLEI